MLIVEQDGTYTVNYDNVGYTSIAVDEEEKNYAIAAVIIGERKIILGVYKTEKRAREVLKEIVNFYEVSERYKYSGTMNIFIEEKFVYEMPKQ